MSTANMLALVTQSGDLPPPWLMIGLRGLEFILVVYTVYVTLLPLAGFFTRRQRRRHPPTKRFAIVIPAHNERLVVGNLVDSCMAMEYARRLFDVYVIADNCDDDTAEVARAHGARVIERRTGRRRGKGHALADAFRQLQRGAAAYDAVAVFDADNLVAPDFLTVMNEELMAGRHVIQGRPDVKNPDDTWVAATFGMSFWTTNRFWFLAKHNLGFSAALAGTGMCISMQALREVGWEPTTLTEDLEFSAKALLAGYKTYWSHDAVIYDEKPLTFAQSCRQRLRWAQGQTQVAAYYLPRLLWASVRNRDPLPFEHTLALFQPFYVILSTWLLAASPVMAHFWTIAGIRLGTSFWIGLVVANYVLPVAAMLYDRRPLRPLRFLALYPLFTYSWVPLTWGGLLYARNHEWAHTVHTRALRYAQLANGKGAS